MCLFCQLYARLLIFQKKLDLPDDFNNQLETIIPNYLYPYVENLHYIGTFFIKIKKLYGQAKPVFLRILQK